MLNSLVKKKIDLFEKFKQLTLEQQQMLTNGDYQQIETLFAEKDTLIQQIDELDLQLGQEDKGNTQLQSLLQELQELNIQLEAGLLETKKNIAAKLTELQQNRKTDGLYHQPFTQVEGAFLDKKH